MEFLLAMCGEEVRHSPSALEGVITCSNCYNYIFGSTAFDKIL